MKLTILGSGTKLFVYTSDTGFSDDLGPFAKDARFAGWRFKTLKLLLVVLCLLLPRTDVPLLESGQGTTLRKQTSTPAEIKILSYNIRWRSGQDLKDMIKLLKDDPEIGGASILALQEVDRAKKRSGNNNTAKIIADELGLYYAWAAPPPVKPTSEEETGVAILSVYPLSDVKRIVLPHPGPGQRRRVALGATVEIENRQWRIYSAHAETRIKFGKKLEQFKAVLEDLANYPEGHARDNHGRLQHVGAERTRQSHQTVFRCGP